MDRTIDEILEYETRFAEFFYDSSEIVDSNSPELRFVQYLCDGCYGHALKLFSEHKQYGGERSCIDAPSGRYEGLDGIREFCKKWLMHAGAERSWVLPCRQTKGSGCSCTEVVACFQIPGREKILQFPMLLIGDLRDHGKLDELRIYYFYQWLPGISAYRYRIFKPEHAEQTAQNLLCGVLKEYSYCLENLDEPGMLDRMLALMGPDIRYTDGRPEHLSPPYYDRNAMYGFYRRFMKSKKPGATQMPAHIQFVKIIDDGVCAVCEWVAVTDDDDATNVPGPGQEALQSGVGIYIRDTKTNQLREIHVYDNECFPKEINWDQVRVRY